MARWWRAAAGALALAGCVDGSLAEAVDPCADGGCGGGGGGGGGGGAPGDGCATEADCGVHRVRPDVFQDSASVATGERVVCAPEPGRCDAPPCPPRLACVPSRPRARPGGMRCRADEDCTAGRCVFPVDGAPGTCFRACASDGECPLLAGRPEVGLSCREIAIDGATFGTCLPPDDAPERTLCRDACDCADDPACDPAALAAGAPLACRFFGHPDGEAALDAVPLCVPPGGDRSDGARCDDDPLACRGGACVQGCLATRQGDAGVHFCELAGTRRCTSPCAPGAACADRLACAEGSSQETVGLWQDRVENDLGSPRVGRDVRLCRLPDQGCFDELDCVPRAERADGAGSWSTARLRCTVDAAARATLCLDPAGRGAPPGAPCAGHDDCDSALCVEARAGGRVCSVPCDPDPGFDRCRELPAVLGPEGALFATTACEEVAYGAAFRVRACR